MDIYLTNGSKRIRFPLNPEQIQVTEAAHMESYTVLLTGGVELPRGTEVSSIAWDGIFPGAARKNLPFVKSWQDPKSLVSLISSWKNGGAKCRLLITETPINLDVYIAQFQHTWLGGFHDCQYHIELRQAKSLVVAPVGMTTAVSSTSRPRPPVPKTYVVKQGDSLWLIAKRFTGSGSRWQEMYQLNRAIIGPDPNKLKIGLVLRVPSNW
jgi:nucleoid-associated protein YgaU